MSLILLYAHLIGVFIFLSCTYFLRGLMGLKPKPIDFFEAFIWEITIFGILGALTTASTLKKEEKKQENKQEKKQNTKEGNVNVNSH